MSNPRQPFLPYAANCGKCGDLMVTTYPRQFIACKCGASSIDSGDGLYWRCGGQIATVWRKRKGTLKNPITTFKRLNFSTQ